MRMVLLPGCLDEARSALTFFGLAGFKEPSGGGGGGGRRTDGPVQRLQQLPSAEASNTAHLRVFSPAEQLNSHRGRRLCSGQTTTRTSRDPGHEVWFTRRRSSDTELILGCVPPCPHMTQQSGSRSYLRTRH
ncbi:unnamed protein product [Pleuronectes platessa]|uniref:Uncharacterized protein n=1 Tax=Pleuronectes platessa TaxID=8262 RepID=A0A9N7YC38_PLEPL|nr:unnamed protein product [Pleuronectes platessa]